MGELLEDGAVSLAERGWALRDWVRGRGGGAVGTGKGVCAETVGLDGPERIPVRAPLSVAFVLCSPLFRVLFRLQHRSAAPLRRGRFPGEA